MNKIPDWIIKGMTEKDRLREEERNNRPIVLTRLPVGCNLIAEMQTANNDTMTLVVVDGDEESLINRSVEFKANTPTVSKNRKVLEGLLPGDQLRIVSRRHSRLEGLTEVYMELYSRSLTEQQRLIVFSGCKASVAHENMEFFFEGLFEKQELLRRENPRRPHSLSYYNDLIKQIKDIKKHVSNLQEKSYKYSYETLAMRGLVEEDQFYA